MGRVNMGWEHGLASLMEFDPAVRGMKVSLRFAFLRCDQFVGSVYRLCAVPVLSDILPCVRAGKYHFMQRSTPHERSCLRLREISSIVRTSKAKGRPVMVTMFRGPFYVKNSIQVDTHKTALALVERRSQVSANCTFILTGTAMSNPRLPPEISDYIVDLLHDQPETLKRCCLVSRSWVPRTRTHLFGEIGLGYRSDQEAWKDAFPDPTNSPAHYVRSLSFSSGKAVAYIVKEAEYWIRVFCNVVRIKLELVFRT